MAQADEKTLIKSSSPSIAALLPMKANSSRVVNKNFRHLAGKPLYAWILDTLLKIPEISKVVVNTDAREKFLQAGLRESDRVLVRDRKQEICGDEISMNLILADDIEAVPADIYVMTHATNPFVSKETISGAIEKFVQKQAEGKADSLFSVNRTQTRFYRSDGSAVNHDPTSLIPTQELEPWYEENSNFYLFTKKSFLATKARIGIKPTMYEVSRIESIDIDVEEDWDLAEIIASAIQNRKNSAAGVPDNKRRRS